MRPWLSRQKILKIQWILNILKSLFVVRMKPNIRFNIFKLNLTEVSFDLEHGILILDGMASFTSRQTRWQYSTISQSTDLLLSRSCNYLHYAHLWHSFLPYCSDHSYSNRGVRNSKTESKDILWAVTLTESVCMWGADKAKPPRNCWQNASFPCPRA